jgi:outer membrane lipoprotein-sorting protein
MRFTGPNNILKYVIAGALWLVMFPGLSGQSATEIVKAADEKVKGLSTQATVTIRIVRPTWQREISLKTWSKGDAYALILVTAPAKDKGMVSLKRDKEVWNWMPSIERTIKLPPSMMTQSWMGTDFTNDDLVKQSSIVTDYIHSLEKDTVIENLSCYKIVMTPKPEAAVVWGKIVIYISKKDYMQLRAEYFDEDGYLINIMSGSKIRNLGGKMLPSEMEMIPVDKPGQKTVLIYNTLVFDVPIEEDFFTVQRMKTVR